MQIDTGATKSLLPYKVFNDMLCDTPITKTARKFKSYTHHPIKVEGYATLPTRYTNKFVDVQYYVVHVNQKPLLSGQVSEQLGLIERIHEVVSELDKYPELKKNDRYVSRDVFHQDRSYSHASSTWIKTSAKRTVSEDTYETERDGS